MADDYDDNELEADPEKVYEIDINKKYILILPRNIPSQEIWRVREILNAWLEDPAKPIIVMPGVKIVKISD